MAARVARAPPSECPAVHCRQRILLRLVSCHQQLMTTAFFESHMLQHSCASLPLNFLSLGARRLASTSMADLKGPDFILNGTQGTQGKSCKTRAGCTHAAGRAPACGWPTRLGPSIPNNHTKAPACNAGEGHDFSKQCSRRPHAALGSYASGIYCSAQCGTCGIRNDQ